MTSDEIIRMAREAAARHGHTLKEQPEPETVEFITELAAMAAAAEREACAKLCEQVGEPNPDDPNSALGEYYKDSVCYECAEAIRARSNK